MDSENSQINTNISSSIEERMNQTINDVLNQSQLSNDTLSKKDKNGKKSNKRTSSLNVDQEFDKKTKYNINCEDFSEASRLFSRFFERLDSLEDECNILNSYNTTLKNELKNTNSNYTKLLSKHSNLVKEFESLKQVNNSLKSDFMTLDSKVTNQNVDEMNGITNNQLTTISFADILKQKKDKIVSEPMVEIINTINNYSNQKKGRENNIIIFGFKNVTSETASNNVNTLFNKMKINNIKFKNPVLLVKKGVQNNSPPIKVSLENEETKFKILKAAKCLKEINQLDNTNIHISQDLNEIDRLLHKKLLYEKKLLNEKLLQDNMLDYYYGIRSNKVVKIMK